MNKSAMFLVGAVCAAMSATADAAIRLNATRMGNFIASGPRVAVPLDALGATTLGFNLPSAKKVLLTYSAECGATGSGWVDIDVVVNGIVVTPTGAVNEAICVANASPLWVRASITLQIDGKKGRNTVQIMTVHSSGGTQSIGDSALVIFD